MKINLFISNDQLQHSLIKFLISNKKIKFEVHKLSDLNLFEYEKNFIILTKELTANYIRKVLKYYKNYDLNSLCFFLPFFTKKKILDYKINCFFYPTQITDL